MSATDDARAFWRYGQEDLAGSERLLGGSGIAPRLACALAQQAVEKALKAALVIAGVEPPFTHNLNVLRNLLPEGWQVAAEYPSLTQLTFWAVEARYPSDLPDATHSDAAAALAQAKAVLATVEGDLLRHGFVPETEQQP